MKQLVRARIRRVYVEEGTYFITAVTLHRHRIFAQEGEIARLRETLRTVKEAHPFTMLAYVFLHEHFHLLIRLGQTTDISKMMHSIKRNYTLNYKAARGGNGRVTLWQHGFWDHVIRNEQDFQNHMDYIHYNPVKHGYVARPEDYPHSSYVEYVRRGWYEMGWGHKDPDCLTDINIPDL